MGRHVLGSNYFYYVRDPWGSYAEYSHDIDFVPAGSIWPAAIASPGVATPSSSAAARATGIRPVILLVVNFNL